MPATTGVYHERSRRAPTQVWRGRPRPRNQRIPFRDKCNGACSFVTAGQFLWRDPRLVIGGRGRPPHMDIHMSIHMDMPANSAVLPKYRYRRRLPHLQKADAAMFVTFCTGARMALPEAARDLALEHCLREGGIHLSRARAPAPHPPHHESICMRSWSCRTTCTCFFRLWGTKTAGRFRWWTFCSA
jgi:hypothetical protein